MTVSRFALIAESTPPLEQMEAELAQGYPPPWPPEPEPPTWVVCDQGHRLTEWEVLPGYRCIRCKRIADNLRRRLDRPPPGDFWARVDKTDSCWYWKYPGGDGYGVWREIRVHRYAYEELVGPIPDGLEIDHKCHNSDLSCKGGRSCVHRSCVNPDHLEPVTHRENMRRAAEQSATRKTIRRERRAALQALYPQPVDKSL